MSDVMLYGVLRMPYEMAMHDHMSCIQYYQRAREAADRLEKAEARLAELDRAPVSTPQQSAQRASVDSPEFWALIAEHINNCDGGASDKAVLASRAALIAHINAWGSAGSGAIPDGWQVVPEVPTTEMVCAIEAKIDEQLVASAIRPADMFRQDGETVYAAALDVAPAPQGEQA